MRAPSLGVVPPSWAVGRLHGWRAFLHPSPLAEQDYVCMTILPVPPARVLEALRTVTLCAADATRAAKGPVVAPPPPPVAGPTCVQRALLLLCLAARVGYAAAAAAAQI